MVETHQVATTKIITPCRNACVVDWRLKYCTGCNRTLTEIQHWQEYTHDQRRDIIKQIKHRDETFFRDQCRLP